MTEIPNQNKQKIHIPAGEYLDMVDTNDQVIGRALRSTVYKENGSNFRVVNGFLKNGEGKLWIPTRTNSKRIFPNALDFSIGEHVESGESYDDALRRGAREELHLDIEETGYSFVGKLTPTDGTASFMHVYEIASDTEPFYNKSDFSEGTWFSSDELQTSIKNGTAVKSDLIVVLNKFYPPTEEQTVFHGNQS